MSSPIQSMKKQVEQLRQEASIQRISVSQAATDLMGYVSQHAEKDALLVGMTPQENPFRDQKSCAIL